MTILRKYYLDSQLLIEKEELRKLEEKNINNKDIQSLIDYKKFEIESLIRELAGFDN